jgi:hypothetical protein
MGQAPRAARRRALFPGDRLGGFRVGRVASFQHRRSPSRTPGAAPHRRLGWEGPGRACKRRERSAERGAPRRKWLARGSGTPGGGAAAARGGTLARDERGSVTCNGRNAPGNPGTCRARAASRAGDSGTVGERGSGRAGRVAMTGSAAVSPRKAQWLGRINPYLVDVFGLPTRTPTQIVLRAIPVPPRREGSVVPRGRVPLWGGGQMRPAPLGGNGRAASCLLGRPRE